MHGFPYYFETPVPSFKVLKSLMEYGQAISVRQILQSKKGSRLDKDSVWAGVLKFGGPRASRIVDPIYDKALDWLRKEINVSKKFPISSYDTLEQYIPTGTSPGLPYIQTHPGLKKGDILEKFRPAFRGYWTRVYEGKPVVDLPDCAAFARSHISGLTTNKVLPVWAYPMLAIVGETIFAQPLITALVEQDIGHNTAYGMEMLNGGMMWLNHQVMKQKMKNADCKIFLGDYSAFDSTVPAWVIRDVFSVIREKLDFTINDKGEPQFRKMINYFINTPIRNTDGRRFRKDHGIPSGTMFTNIMGTFVNLVVMRVLLKKTTGQYPLWINCFGDDSVVVMPHVGRHFATLQSRLQYSALAE